MVTGSYPHPSRRRLRVYAFDPSASVELETAVINDAVLSLVWEKPWEDGVDLGPSNEYLEVIDYDFPARTFYAPVDLNDPLLLAQDGLPPSEACPQFHQQMVFAVAMHTIRNFERALGRYVFWSKAPQPEAAADFVGPVDVPEAADAGGGRGKRAAYPSFEKRLRIYPHALREANAYYSPEKVALLFGYFKSPPENGVPEGSWVFTCLSQDIIAHETTHAILHGLRRRSVEPQNPDSLALHEGFADIVALFQHFTMTNVVEHELARNGGRLRSAQLLTGLANQFGRATGRNGALRQALATLSAEADRPVGEVLQLSATSEAHERGGVLVAAVFDAFVTIFERRTADLFQLAGVRPGAESLPDRLVKRLAEEAGRAAHFALQMCVRGLDYLPPVSPTFGEYLRAIITADTDLIPDDPWRFRVAFAESFRKRGIPVPGCMSYAPESLCWDAPDLFYSGTKADLNEVEVKAMLRAITRADLREWDRPEGLFAEALNKLYLGIRYRALFPDDEEAAASSSTATSPYLHPGERNEEPEPSDCSDGAARPRYNLREESMQTVTQNQARLHEWLEAPSQLAKDSREDRMWEYLLGIRMLPQLETGEPKALRSIPEGTKKWQVPKSWRQKDHDAFGPAVERQLPKFDVHSVRLARRAGPGGTELHQLIAQVTQKRRGCFDDKQQKKLDSGETPHPVDEKGRPTEPDFWFRGGATIIVDLRNGQLQHVIRKRIDDDGRLDDQRRFVLGDAVALAMVANDLGCRAEPFAFMHDDEQ
ncbi:MAG: hypothetical protein ABW194_01340 [Novosphingobium sp.]